MKQLQALQARLAQLTAERVLLESRIRERASDTKSDMPTIETATRERIEAETARLEAEQRYLEALVRGGDSRLKEKREVLEAAEAGLTASLQATQTRQTQNDGLRADLEKIHAQYQTDMAELERKLNEAHRAHSEKIAELDKAIQDEINQRRDAKIHDGWNVVLDNLANHTVELISATGALVVGSSVFLGYNRRVRRLRERLAVVETQIRAEQEAKFVQEREAERTRMEAEKAA